MPDGARPQAARTRCYDYTTAGFDMEAARSMSGLDYMRALVSGEIGGKPSISDTLGMSIPFDLAEGRCSVEADAADFLLNPMGAVHGGFAAALLDTAVGCAVHTALPAGIGYTTAELKINYTRAITPEVGRLRATGTTIHVGRRMATAEAKLTGVEDGRLYAHASTTCFLFPLPPG